MIQQFKENQRKIKTISNNLDKLEEKNKKEIYKIKYTIYDKKLRELIEERNKKINTLKEDFYKVSEKQNKEIKNLYFHINKVKRILEFMKIKKEGVKNLDFKAYSYYGYPKEKNYLKPLAIILNDEFKNIQVFIYENDKPKNKFSLCVVGMTIFNTDILEIPKSYGLHINKENGYFNIEKGIKDLPTKEELKIYYEKNKDKILNDFLEEHKKAEEEYKEVLNNYINKKDWVKLYLESRLYYYENCYSHGKETEEYKKIKKEIKNLKGDKE